MYKYKYLNDVKEVLQNLKNTYCMPKNTFTFYSTRINKFFELYMSHPDNINRPQNTITYFYVNTYLDGLTCSPSEKVNCYQALKRYFEFTYFINITLDVMTRVEKPLHVIPNPKYISDSDYQKLVEFCTCRENILEDRLLIGMFLFTGLSRTYIANLTNFQFNYSNGVYCLVLWKENIEYSIPLKTQLQFIIDEQVKKCQKDNSLKIKVFDMDENCISTKVSDLTKRIVGKCYTPTEFSNTFIKKCLEHGNHVWEVSTLILKSITSIQKHISDNQNLFAQQTAILNSF